MSKMSIIMSGRNKPRFLVDDIYYEGIDIPSKELIGEGDILPSRSTVRSIGYAEQYEAKVKFNILPSY